MLMDHFKAHIKDTYQSMMHFLTYADNFAVGYFRKQGFSKDITLDRSVWAGYIKDYEGGTIMQCTMLPKVDYTKKVEILAAQKEAILSKIREKSKSHIVYEGLPQFQEGMVDEGEEVKIDPKEVPGLRKYRCPSKLVNTGESKLKPAIMLSQASPDGHSTWQLSRFPHTFPSSLFSEFLLFAFLLMLLTDRHAHFPKARITALCSACSLTSKASLARGLS
jgi:hypothetical protein